MTELPPGWTKATLAEVGQYVNGRGFKKSEWREAGRPIIRIQNLTRSSQHFNYFDGEPEEQYTARPGDVLVSWAATLGVFVWKGPEGVVNQHIFKVRSHIDREFHRYLLLSLLDDLRRQAHGSGMVHITKSRFEQTPVAIPPLAEQHRIVAAIEERFSRLDAAENSLVRARWRVAVLRRLIRSLAVAEGVERAVGDLLDGIEAGKSFKCHSRRAGQHEWGVIKVSSMTWGSFNENENKAVIADDHADPRWEIRPGDLLLSRANTTEYVGAPVLVRRSRPRLLLSDKSMRLLVRVDVDKAWLQLALSSPQSRAQMSAVATGTSDSMRNISQEKVRAVRLCVPSRDRQRQIVAEIEQRLSIIDAMERRIDAVRSRSGALRRSILDRAFAGLLVPQDPTDEPAGALLERIAAEQAAGVSGNRAPTSKRRQTARAS